MKDDHVWTIFMTSTAGGRPALIAHCFKCWKFGEVADPSSQEWQEAFGCSSSPYPWEGGDHRVTLLSEEKCKYWEKFVPPKTVCYRPELHTC